MNVGQMLAHVNISLETQMGLNFPKRMFIERIIGGFMKSKFLNDKPMDKNSSTDKNYVFTDTREFEKEKAKAAELIKPFSESGTIGLLKAKVALRLPDMLLLLKYFLDYPMKSSV